ncbi:MAG: hypothetical protein M3063_16600 [Actinomycetota bacterium]|nr:hypothetical protein [Actinomycetota bacterium]
MGTRAFRSSVDEVAAPAAVPEGPTGVAMMTTGQQPCLEIVERRLLLEAGLWARVALVVDAVTAGRPYIGPTEETIRYLTSDVLPYEHKIERTVDAAAHRLPGSTSATKRRRERRNLEKATGQLALVTTGAEARERATRCGEVLSTLVAEENQVLVPEVIADEETSAGELVSELGGHHSVLDAPVSLLGSAAGPMNAGDGDGTEQLSCDHREMEELFDEFAKPQSSMSLKYLILRTGKVISEHLDVEAAVLGPIVRSRLADGHRIARVSLGQHRGIERLLAKIERRSVSSPDLAGLVTQLASAVHRLASEEESSTFAQVRASLNPAELHDLGDRMLAARRWAATRPHPYLPHRGRLARVTRASMGIADRVRDKLIIRL